MWLFALLVALPLVEIALFVVVGGAIGLWATLAWVLGTGFAGMAIIRAQGMRGLVDLRRERELMRNPVTSVAHGAFKVLAGLLLLLPGFLTDALGLLLLIRPLRSLLIAGLSARIGSFASGMPRHGGQAEVIDADFTVIARAEDEDPPQPGGSGWTKRH